jgi:hypothetical protein
MGAKMRVNFILSHPYAYFYIKADARISTNAHSPEAEAVFATALNAHKKFAFSLGEKDFL